MNTILLILAVLSIGAVLIAAYVFTVAARNYVSEMDSQVDDDSPSVATADYVIRSAHDRRQISNVVAFPMTLSNGEVVYRDRRLSERRRAA